MKLHVGQQMLYCPRTGSDDPFGFECFDFPRYAAFVARITGPAMVNLMVIDPYGGCFSRYNIVVAEKDPLPGECEPVAG